MAELIHLKSNVGRFDKDVGQIGSYAYTTERLSARYANARISERIAEMCSPAGKRILDVGCGDGTYTREFAALGAREVLGVDPATAAVAKANRIAEETWPSLRSRLRYRAGSIYDLDEIMAGSERFDCVVLRGVLHHLPDPAQGVLCAAAWADTMIILEPNGYNPVLKLIERTSPYHIEHEEQSFWASTIEGWVARAGFQLDRRQHFNLVPFFCPDWAVAPLRSLEPLVERVPLLAAFGCGQFILQASRTSSS